MSTRSITTHTYSAAHFRVIDLNNLLAGMSDLLRRSLGEMMEFGTVLAVRPRDTFANVSQVENAILNLAINARDGMVVGGWPVDD